MIFLPLGRLLIGRYASHDDFSEILYPSHLAIIVWPLSILFNPFLLVHNYNIQNEVIESGVPVYIPIDGSCHSGHILVHQYMKKRIPWICELQTGDARMWLLVLVLVGRQLSLHVETLWGYGTSLSARYASWYRVCFIGVCKDHKESLLTGVAYKDLAADHLHAFILTAFPFSWWFIPAR